MTPAAKELAKQIGNDRPAILSLIEDIAEHLPGEWDMRPFPADWNWGAYLTNPETQAIITISSSLQRTDRNKLEIRGDVPKDIKGEQPYLGYNVRMPTISVSASKSGEQIARDIERRFLPVYLPILEKALETIEGHNAYHNKTTDMAMKVAALVKVPWASSDSKGSSKDVSFYHSPYPIFHEVPLSEAQISSDTVELKLQLDYETTLKVLKYLIAL